MIITNNPEILKEFIRDFNKKNSSDLMFVESFLDEVNFSIVTYANTSVNQLFKFGCLYGGHIKKLHLKGKILSI